MTGCSAPNCTRSTRQGYRLYQFPKDPKRRKRWHLMTKRANWSPTATAKLCEVHFEPDQFVRASGRERLRAGAVPTLFDDRPVAKGRKPPNLRGLSRGIDPRQDTPSLQDHNYCSSSSSSSSSNMPDSTKEAADRSRPRFPAESACCETPPGNPCDEESESTAVHSPNEPVQTVGVENNGTLWDVVPCQQIVHHEEHVRTCHESCSDERQRLFQTIATQQRKYSALSKKFRKLNVAHARLRSPSKKKRKWKWKPEEIGKALRLKFSCGTAGYLTLIREGFELPSVATLCRHLGALSSEPGLLQEALEVPMTSSSSNLRNQPEVDIRYPRTDGSP